MQEEKPRFELIGASLITTIYQDKKSFKKDFHLHELRFAVTLCKKQPGDTDFRRCDATQYISEVSIEDKKRKRKISFHFDHFVLFFQTKFGRQI